jgi:hypothetical protein
MPPLATTQAGLAGSAPDHLGDGGRHPSRDLQALGGVPAASQLAADGQQHVGVVQRRDHQPCGLGDVAIAPGGVGDGGDVDLDLGQAATVPGDRHLPAG